MRIELRFTDAGASRDQERRRTGSGSDPWRTALGGRRCAVVWGPQGGVGHGSVLVAYVVQRGAAGDVEDARRCAG